MKRSYVNRIKKAQKNENGKRRHINRKNSPEDVRK